MDHGNASWQAGDREPLKFELHELVRVCNTDSEYYDQAGHVRAIRPITSDLFAYIVEFEGENGMPEFGSGELSEASVEWNRIV